MAYPLLQVVDPADDSTVLFDMNDDTGAANPNSVKTFFVSDEFDLGEDPLERSIFEGDQDGGETVFMRRGLADMSWRMRAQATTYANLVAGIGTLGKYLERGGVIKYQATASDAARWIDFEPATAPALFRGQNRALFKVLTLLQDPDGALLTVQRQPGLRGASQNFLAATAIPNDPSDSNGRTITFSVPGDLPALASLKVQAPASAKLQRILVARRSSGKYATTRVTEWASTTKAAQLSPTGVTGGWTVTAGTDYAAITPDADASGNNVAEISFASAHMVRRVRVTRTANMDSLRGVFDVYIRCKATGAGKFVMQLRHGPSLADPAPVTEVEALPFDTTGQTTFTYTDWFLGRISIPQGHMLGGFAAELLARRESGTGALRADFLFFVPAGAEDAVTIIGAPAGASEVWRGDQLVAATEPGGLSAGAVVGTSLVLNAANEAGVTPPSVAGQQWPAGRHVWFVTGQNNSRTSASLIFRVRNLTDDTYAVTKTFTPIGAFRQMIEFDIGVGTHAATDFYQAQIVDNSGGAGGTISIWTIGRDSTTYLVSGEEAHAERHKGLLHKMDSSDNIAAPLEIVSGPFPLTLPPGTNGLAFIYMDVKGESGAPGFNSVLTEDCTVTIAGHPRYKVG